MFLVTVEHHETAVVEVEAENPDEAAELVWEYDIDWDWGCAENNVLSVEEIA